MKKEGILFTLVVISILLISVSFVSAGLLGDVWNKITGKSIDENITDENILNESEATQSEEDSETTPEVCAASISLSFNQNVYYVGDLVEITTEVFDSQGNHIPNYVFYVTIYDTMWHTPFSQETGADGYFRQTGTAIVESASGVGKSKYKVYTQESGSCGVVEDIVEIEVISGAETGSEPKPIPPVEDPKEDPTTCAAKIKISFDKTSYAPGDKFDVEVGVFDSQGNPLSNYPFYVKMYDDKWHSPDLQKTGADGYFRDSGETPQKAPSGITKGIFTAYIEETSSCNSVEDTTELTLEEPEPIVVPCGMGSCIPIEDKEKEPTKIPDDKKVFYRCDGCEIEDKCYPVGYRKEGTYCSIDNNEFVSQMEEMCDNNFECKSNLCLSGECIEDGLVKKVIKWFRKTFGGDENDGEKEPEPKMCSKLLVEKNIGDNEYLESGYGFNEHTQVPVYSEDGKNIETIKCCAAEYSTGMAIVCPFENEEEVKNSLMWILGGDVDDSYELEEYKGEKVVDISDGEILVWTNSNYLIASGGKPNENNKFVEEIVDAYFKEYPSSFDLTEDDIPYVLQPDNPETWISCTSEKDMLTEDCHFVDDFENGLEKWTFSKNGLGYDGSGEVVVEDNNTFMRLVGVNRANVHKIWDNFLFKFRFKMVEGNVHVDFRREEIPPNGAKRYVVSINDNRVINLNREISQDFQELEKISLGLDDNWHTLEIRSYDDIINVYVDNELVAKHKDTVSPLYSGWVRFEAHTGGVPGVIPELLVDDVEIRLITEEDIIYP